MSYSDIEVSQVGAEEEEGTWEVEAVVDMRKIRGRRQFLIKWKDFNSDDNTWEDESNLNCPALVTQFLEEREKKHKQVREERKKEQAKSKKTPEPKKQQKQATEPKQTKVKAEPKKQESKKSPSPKKAAELKKPAQPKKEPQTETTKPQTETSKEKSPKSDGKPQSVCGAFAKLENGKRRVFYVFRMSNGTEKVLSSSQAKHLDKNMVLDFLVKGFQASERRLFCMTH